jgi:hypothetical protein
MQGTEVFEERLKAMKPGDVLAACTAEPDPQAVVLVRERSAVIKYFGETGVELRAARFRFDRVAVAAMAMRLGQTVPMTYAVLLDYQRREGSGIFRALGRQEYVPVYFYGDNFRRDRTFLTMNRMQGVFTAADAAIRAMPRWDADDFAAAAAKLIGRFPTPGALWAAMEG